MSSNVEVIQFIDQGKLHQFHGGIHPPSRKERTNQKSIIDGPKSNKLFIPLAQHAGHAAICAINVLDKVNAGQIIGQSDGFISANIIAPASGKILEVIAHPASHASGLTTETIVLEVADDEKVSLPALSLSDDNEVLINRIKQSGMTGLGGASFPTSVKLSPRSNVDVLILNGAECEPYITSDDVLMQDHSAQIVAGIKVMQKLLTPTRIIIGIEDNKPQAISAMKNAILDHDDIIVRSVPTLYPAGGEKQLIEVLTGQQVPSKKIPADIGIVVQNVATAYAIADAVFNGTPLLSRVVTVSGDLVERPGNYRVTLGTPIIDLLEFCGFKSAAKQKIIMGGPMMGFALNDLSSPVIKSTNCIIAASNQELPDAPTEQNCIRCGDCEQVCPAQLLPQQLQWFAKDNDHEKLEKHDLFDCIECGACAYVCPSHIPLVQYYRIAKADIRETHKEQELAQRAKERFEQRAERLERDKQEREEKNRIASERRKAALQNSKAASSTGTNNTGANNDGAADSVAAALARIKAKKSPQGADAPAEKSNDPVAAAIARAKAKRAAAAAAKSAQQEESTEQVVANNAVTSNPDKDRVAAAIARAKAKRQAQKDDFNSNAVSNVDANDKQELPAELTTEPTTELTPELSAAEERKARIAATVAKAKAKKLDQEKLEQAKLAQTTSTEPPAELTPELSAADERKARIAATVAKAKAKKLAQEQSIATDVSEPESQEPSAPQEKETNELSAAEERKARIAATVAKAKAKKLEQELLEQEKLAQEQLEQDSNLANTEIENTTVVAQSEELSVDASTDTINSESDAISAEDAKKARIAAVVAKAKAKRLAAQQTQSKDE